LQGELARLCVFVVLVAAAQGLAGFDVKGLLDYFDLIVAVNAQKLHELF
jgi:hypothetical protein